MESNQNVESNFWHTYSFTIKMTAVSLATSIYSFVFKRLLIYDMIQLIHWWIYL